MGVMEQFDKATVAQIPLRLTGRPERPIEVDPEATELSWEALGVADGFQGLIAGRLHPLSDRGVGGILHRGGTILGTTRAPESRRLKGRAQPAKHSTGPV